MQREGDEGPYHLAYADRSDYRVLVVRPRRFRFAFSLINLGDEDFEIVDNSEGADVLPYKAIVQRRVIGPHTVRNATLESRRTPKAVGFTSLKRKAVHDADVFEYF